MSKDADALGEAELPRDKIPDDGKIGRTSTGQTILAVAFLIFVALIAFMGVTFIGQFIPNNQVTYWMIELIFALLCGGAGALVGGSAAVRSTLKIPGSPVQATVGGAVSMVIVGFIVAYLGSPQPEDPTYPIQILGIPQMPQDVDGVAYNVFVGPVGGSNVSFARESDNVTLRIPRRPGIYRVMVAVYQTSYQGKPEISRTLARCQLVFTSSAGTPLVPMQIVPESDQQFRLYFPRNYIAKVVRDALKRKDEKAVVNEPCVEGVIASKDGAKTLLRNDFTLLPANIGTRLSSVARLNLTPRFSILARNLSDNDPERPAADVPPEPRTTTGLAVPESPPKVTVQASAAPAPPKPQTSAPSQGAAPGGSEAHAPPPRPDKPAPPTDAQGLEAQVLSYIRGDDFDRTRLYQSWDKVSDFVVQGFRADAAANPDRAARYLNLISNALGVIDDGKYLAPTVRPNADQSVKPSRLGSGSNIPGFSDEDYKSVVSLLYSRSPDARSAAQRLLRLFPSNRFYHWLQLVQKQQDIDDGQFGFVSESAIYFFYNRIVEYDGTFDLDKSGRDWLDGNYEDGVAWVQQASARAPKYAVLTALLDYGYGLVLWDHKDKDGALEHFGSMLRTVASTGQPYPSNPRHLALALQLMNAPGRFSKNMRSATALDSNDLHSLSESYVADGRSVPLFALPEPALKAIGKLSPDQKARIYLRSGDWDLIQSGDKIGWAKRAMASSN